MTKRIRVGAARVRVTTWNVGDGPDTAKARDLARLCAVAVVLAPITP